MPRESVGMKLTGVGAETGNAFENVVNGFLVQKQSEELHIEGHLESYCKMSLNLHNFRHSFGILSTETWTCVEMAKSTKQGKGKDEATMKRWIKRSSKKIKRDEKRNKSSNREKELRARERKAVRYKRVTMSVAHGEGIEYERGSYKSGKEKE